MAKIQGRMNHVWVLEHRDGKVSAKRNDKGELNPYHTRQGHSKRDSVATIGLNDEQGKPIAVVDVPVGAEVFQRHRCNIPINYFNRFHEVSETTPESFDATTRQVIPTQTIKRNLGEITYGEVWLVGWRKREVDGSVTVHYKAVYPDGKVDEHNGWSEKPWLYEPEWFSEEQV